MPTLPDLSEWYGIENARREEVQWVLNPSQQRQDAEFVSPRLAVHGIKDAVECGCGSGIFAFMLPFDLVYNGFDKNVWLVKRANQRLESSGRTGARFSCWDVRNFEGKGYDLVLAFAFMKHFALDEWDKIFQKVLSLGRFAAFDVQTCEREFDNGTLFHHSFVTEDHLMAAIVAAGHHEIERQIAAEFVLPTGERCRRVHIWTKRTKTFPVLPQMKLVLPQKDIHPNRVLLEVDGTVRQELTRYALRWHDSDGKKVPVLYQDGKRLACAWKLWCELEVPADPHGESGNTA